MMNLLNFNLEQIVPIGIFLIFLLIISSIGYEIYRFFKHRSAEKKHGKALKSKIRSKEQYKELHGANYNTNVGKKSLICPICNIFADQNTKLCPKCGKKL
ncbi:MAG: hypothetical protein KGD57_07565 [Candidatus Lokiarchaeota archaeon]|nr:hypothetical protein [Candidatus Lokiarchaeota archaeon]